MSSCLRCGTPTDNPKYCSRHCTALAIRCKTGRHPKPELNRERKPTQLEIAWAAGFWEGEGCCTNVSRFAAQGGNSPRADAAQATMWPLEKLRVIYGGSIGGAGPGRSGYSWRVCGERAVVFLTDIYPMVSPRRQQQIDKALKGRMVTDVRQ